LQDELLLERKDFEVTENARRTTYLSPDKKEEMSVQDIDLLIHQVIMTRTYSRTVTLQSVSEMANLTAMEVKERSCWQRWCGRLTKGSMRGSIFALM